MHGPTPQALVWTLGLLVAAAVCDMFDGAAARAWGVADVEGRALDGVCDAVSFGVAPALALALVGMEAGQPGLLAAAPLHLAAILVRLARVTARSAKPGPSSILFKGLPGPMAALTLVGALVMGAAPRPDLMPTTLLACLSGVISVMMLSPVMWPHARGIARLVAAQSATDRNLGASLLAGVFFAVYASVGPVTALVAGSLAYILSGPTVARRIMAVSARA